MLSEKNYIGKAEAYELLLQDFFGRFERLPRSGTEYVCARSLLQEKIGKVSYALGKDESGYYIITWQL